MNPSLEIDVQPSISLFYDSDRISKLANEGNGSQVGGNKTRRGKSVGTSRRRIYIATSFYLGAVTLFLVESLVRRDANGRECIKPETARSVTGLLKREIKTSQCERADVKAIHPSRGRSQRLRRHARGNHYLGSRISLPDGLYWKENFMMRKHKLSPIFARVLKRFGRAKKIANSFRAYNVTVAVVPLVNFRGSDDDSGGDNGVPKIRENLFP